jgi:hypothetical protein
LLTPGEAPAKSSGCGGSIGDGTPLEDHLGDQGGIVVGRYVATAGEPVPASLRRQLVPVTRLVPEERAGRARRRAARRTQRPAGESATTDRAVASLAISSAVQPPSCRRGALCHARVSRGDQGGRRRNQRGWAETRRTLTVTRRRSPAGRRRSRSCGQRGDRQPGPSREGCCQSRGRAAGVHQSRAPRGVVLAPRTQYSGG